MNNASSPSRASSIIVGGIAAAIGLASVLMIVILWRGVAPSGSQTGETIVGDSIPPEALAAMSIPDFTLTDQRGRSLTKQDVFHGRMTILAFSFTNCPTVCPIMHSHLAQLASETLRNTPVQIVTISVDPTHDTPEALREHAARLGVDDDRWIMLTGDKAVIQDMVRSMKFAIADDPALTITLSDGSTMPNIVHPTKLVLVGPVGTVIGLDSGLDFDSARRLAERARDLARRLGLK